MLKRVLLAEDHPDILRLVEKSVKKAGYECCAVINGLEAIEAFRAQPFDLIIMDGSMPKMDGFGATKRIRALEKRGTRIPIILHSGLSSWDVEDRCQECGIDTFVQKSTMKELIDVVKEYLEGDIETNSHRS